MMHRRIWIVMAYPGGAMILENAGCLREPDLRLFYRLDAPKPRGVEQARTRFAGSAFAAQVVA